MAKAIDLRIKGVKFEDALKKILAAPPLPKKAKSTRKKPVQKPHLN
jgi:hypothetical protein